MPTRAATAAFIVLFGSVPLMELTGPNVFAGISSAIAKSKAKSGNNGNGSGNGNGGGNGSKKGGDGDQDVGSEFHDEGFVSSTPAADLEEYQRSDGGHDKWTDGKDSDFKEHGHKGNWRDDLGLGKQFDLGNIGKSMDADAAGFSELLDAGFAKKGDREDRQEDGGNGAVKADRELPQKNEKSDKDEKQAQKQEKKLEKQQEKLEKKLDKKNKHEEAALALDSAVQPATSDARSVNGAIPLVGPRSYVPREVLALNLSTAGSIRARELGFEMDDSLLEQGALTKLTAPEGMDTLQALALLRRELPAEYFHLNRLYRPYQPATKDDTEKVQRTQPAGPGDGRKCLDDKCYSKAAIHWRDNLAPCTRDVGIGVIDTDIDIQHPTFAGQKITRESFLSGGKQPSPNWHGTGILALLAGRPDSSTPGLIPDAKFFAASIFFAGDDGESVTDTVSLLKSLDWMRTSGAKLVNMSFSGPQDDLVQARIRAMRAQGFVFTAAAGNEGPAVVPAYPAAYPEVIAVTAVTKDLHIYPSASRGVEVDLAAPGVGIWTAAPNSREAYRTGTSFATPFATAVLALQRPDVLYAPKDELLDRVKTIGLGPPGRNPIYGRGLLQAPSECPNAAATVSYSAPVSGSSPR
jgi:hypothetical protein